MILSVTHAELGSLMQQLHTAGVHWVLCELTGLGWVVSFELRGAVVDLSGYRRR